MLRWARYWLLLNIEKTPKVFTYGAGVFVAIVLIAVTAVTVLLVDQARTAERHQRAIELARILINESSDLLERLVLAGNTECTSHHLIQLNALLLRTRFIREIGILDTQGRLLCSTTMGVLPEPIIGNHLSITIPSGREVYIGVPLQVAEGTLKATIVRQERFNVVVSPHLTDTLYSSADIVWLRTDAGLTALKAIPMSQTRLEHLRHQAEQSAETSWRLRYPGYQQITSHPEIAWILQTERSAQAVIQDNSVLVARMIITALLIAVLVVGTITPYVLRRQGIQNRVNFLCDEAHILLTYQPIFDLVSNRPIGCEVLMRLQEGDHIWMPEEIIPAVLRAGLASEFDHTISKKAIRELSKHLPAQPEQFRVSLNFFPESIQQATLAPMLREALSYAPRDDIGICIEVTEHSLSGGLIDEVRGLKAQGFQIAIDDFGTGYSNLKSVTQLSPDILKIDKSFVYELEEATLRSTLIPEIILIAEAVGALTIAEGIEHLDQAKLLAAMGVRYGQGYVLARPMDLLQFLVFMDAAR